MSLYLSVALSFAPLISLKHATQTRFPNVARPALLDSWAGLILWTPLTDLSLV